MQGLLDIILTFPTAPLTVMLGIVICYWLFAIVTGAAFDSHDGAADAVAGGIKGVGESINGAGDSLRGIGEAVKGAAEGSDAPGSAEGGLLSLLGLGRIPVTMTMSTIILIAWTTCTLAMSQLQLTSPVAQSGLLAGSLIVGLISSSIILRPLSKALESAARATRRSDLIGKVCVITSGRVDSTFGTASIEDGGAGLNVHVTCGKANQLQKGDRALILEYNAGTDAYDIEPVDWLLPEEREALKDPSTAERVLSSRVRVK